MPDLPTQRCPYCAEEIRAEAVKCRFCGSMLSGHALTRTWFRSREHRKIAGVCAGLAEEFGQPADTLSDYALRAVYQHNDRRKMYYVLYQDMGEDFRSDLGFNPQVDFRKGQLLSELYWYNDAGRFSRERTVHPIWQCTDRDRL